MAKQDSQSQLKRLKSALRESGISRDQKAKGPRKSRVDREKELAKIRDRFNPYETQINKSKFAVGGRKLKGTEGRPGASASIAENMRRETLGKERQRKGRTGGLVDRRFGEGRADLTPEQIQLERYTRERQKSDKRHNFSLEDEDEEAGLTHLGQSLSTMDDFGPAPISDDEDMGAEMVTRTNFGGFKDSQLEEDEIIGEDGVKRRKTKAEIMQEIIAKSKKGKYERQRQADEDDEAREALDADLEDVQTLLIESERARPSADDGLNADRLKALASEYDKTINELKFELRGKATDRTKTEEELAVEEAKRLHEQEEARMKRMRGEEPDEVNPRDRKRKRKAQGDDLSDDFQSDSDSDGESSEGEFGTGVNATATKQVEIASDEESDEEQDNEETSSLDEGTNDAGLVDLEDCIELSEDGSVANSQSEVDSSADDDSDDEDDLPSEELIAAAKAELARRETQGNLGAGPKSILETTLPVAVLADSSELKFTYPCPSSLDQLLAITKPLKEEDTITALHRIRVLHHPRLNPGNNDKLSKFVTILVDYVLSTEIPALVADYCVSQIHDLSQKYWEPSTQHFLDTLELIRQSMYKKMGVAWQAPELRFFALIGQVWSTSDAYHKVVTPSFLVVSQYLAQNSDDSAKAKSVKLALCAILARWVRDSKRYVPECIQAIGNILDNTEVQTSEGTRRSIDINALASADSWDLHHIAEKMLEQFATIYISSPAYADIFSSFIPRLHDSDVRDKITKSVQNSSASRRPLALQAHRPIPLATFIPKFEESFNLDKKSYDRNADRASDSKMKAEIRDAKRGAVRVLRRDAAFEARENAKERRGKDAVYTAKMKKVENRIRQKDDA